eukprot:TRINITY_DN19521_c0_g1_i1.p1 TRINITY_DN19521_c0_g1~~TRINITY_DN19521_c0_g1_i1.p1  ORF type:complete len:490 (-),score=75.55 TRINITY_DN19521_c0_g1_i1:229-1698(-)
MAVFVGAAAEQAIGNAWEHNHRGRFDRRRFSHAGVRLDKVHWNGIEIVPCNKEFKSEHPRVADRTYNECQDIRLRHSINVRTDDGHDAPKPVTSFEESSFPSWAIDVLREQAFVKPTPIQVQAWPTALKGHDIIAVAETGSGKTLAYVLPMLVHVLAQPELRPNEGPVGLVLVPNRELSRQVASMINLFAEHSRVVCRATADDDQFQLGKVSIMVATLGRFKDLLRKKATNLVRTTFVVLDEADEMLEHKFIEDSMLVLNEIRPDRQLLLFSATWDMSYQEAASKLCKWKPVHIHVGSTQLAACKDIVQELRTVQNGETKSELLIKAIEMVGSCRSESKKVLVFVNSREGVHEIVGKLKENHVACEGFTGSYNDGSRNDILQTFNDPLSSLQVLVSTQILGRGFDFPDLKYVINYDMPCTIVEYIHRIGRTGRAGRKGYALSILTEDNLWWLARPLKKCLEATSQKIPNQLYEACSWRRRERQADGRQR